MNEQPIWTRLHDWVWQRTGRKIREGTSFPDWMFADAILNPIYHTLPRPFVHMWEESGRFKSHLDEKINA